MVWCVSWYGCGVVVVVLSKAESGEEVGHGGRQLILFWLHEDRCQVFTWLQLFLVVVLLWFVLWCRLVVVVYGVIDNI